MAKIKIIEIFDSIEGEGSLVGYPVSFIRLEGCNLRCSWCDTKYSYDTENYKLMDINEILKVIKFFKNKKVCLTGGEPLYNEGFDLLFKTLLEEGYFVIIETNGTLFRNIISVLYKRYNKNIHIVCSPKPFNNFYINDKLLPYIKELKFVVDNLLKIEDILKFKDIHLNDIPIILQPEDNKKEMFKKSRDLQKKLLEKNIEVRIIPQYHKIFEVK
ncbi:7-carboxy-7-deazaguanine synthase QueE [Hydrogenothermus marinus]|uniref:7-carboxy-7-deazaguanine synthase n=1 Tax=Hydrogenothermus marinus TaxID=133270 RepID=A0A3M0BL16_9AQUI|nr:7-carboxy-7-deazaguanine synthase QueE [Hydrogenothermus marinus]RMA97124.1 organic radical activating enzyme [Hydrogenothermus marinus]